MIQNTEQCSESERMILMLQQSDTRGCESVTNINFYMLTYFTCPRAKPSMMRNLFNGFATRVQRCFLSWSCSYHLSISCSCYFQFADKFAEFKEAARLAKEKSQEKMELTSTPSQVKNINTILSSHRFHTWRPL